MPEREIVGQYEGVYRDALQRSLTAYTRGDFRPLTEADWQCYMYAQLLSLLDARHMDPSLIHANWRLSSRPQALSRAKFDLVVGHDELVAEIKFEADYPGVSKPVCFPREVAKDVERLSLARSSGVKDGHLLVVDEDGALHRNLQKYVTHELRWQRVSPQATRQVYVLDLHL